MSCLGGSQLGPSQPGSEIFNLYIGLLINIYISGSQPRSGEPASNEASRLLQHA